VEVIVARFEPEPSFLPLTLSTARTVSAATRSSPAVRASADVVSRKASEANAAAAECWTSLLAGCDDPGTRVLPRRLRELAEATSIFAGVRWWHGDGSAHRQRVGRALQRIEEAITERDGADFAEAFVGYDQAVATALARAHSRLESSAR
jgi:hypothetical protein